MLDAALSLLTDAQPDRFAGLSVRLAQPAEGGEEPQGWCVAADSRDEALSQQASARLRTWQNLARVPYPNELCNSKLGNQLQGWCMAADSRDETISLSYACKVQTTASSSLNAQLSPQQAAAHVCSGQLAGCCQSPRHC